ncbi:MAG: DUF1727 domain-containing protein [Chloroflexi bacterium]|nr:DUF1727 domain-containing protein [Chloroflexota bacterium]
MNPRLSAAIAAGRVASRLTRALRRGGGTVLPGHVAARIDTQALSTLSSRLPQGSVLISGTNGKTTTARMLAQIAHRAGLRPVHNRAGANLPAGILSALLDGCSLMGQPHGDLGIFEVDEAHVPAAVAAIRPRVLVLTNLFRDQLDRYGEVDFVARAWQRAAANLPLPAKLVVNIDDPTLAYLSESRLGPATTFGISECSFGHEGLPHEADHRLCPRCRSRLTYSSSNYGHLGLYVCSGCGWRRPVPDVAPTEIAMDGEHGSDFNLNSDGPIFPTHIPLNGLHNVYNAVAASAAALALDIDPQYIVQGLAEAQGAFGRDEVVQVGDGSLKLVLVKNPVGFNQALRSLGAEDLTLVAINDLFADGTDVSWLWDVDFELLGNRRIVCTGLRAHDMSVRLKYASVDNRTTEPSLENALSLALDAARSGARVAAFCTYTATLEIRHLLQQRGLVAPFWEN